MAITVTTDDIANVATSTAASVLNTNFANVKAGLDKALNRESATDNAMEVDLDMNSNDILNVGAAAVTSLTVSGVDVASIVGLTGAAGATGATGAAGDDGINAGHTYTFSTTTADADPGTGTVRFDNLTMASVAEIYIADTSAHTGNPDISTEILTWDDSTNVALRGTLVVREQGTPANVHIFNITGASTDNTGYTTLAVTHVDGNGTFADAATLSFEFYRTGNKGADGAGVGDVVGPASSIDGVLAVFDGVTGKLLKDGTSGVTPAAVAANTAKLTADTTNVTNAGALMDSELTSLTDVKAIDQGLATTDTVQFTAVELGHATDTTVTRVSAGLIAVEGSNVLMASDIGKQTVWMPAGSITSTTTSGAAVGQVEETTNKHNYATLDFDGTADEYGCFEIMMPESWDEGTITFQFVWSSAASSTNTVSLSLQGVAVGDNEDSDVAYGTAVNVVDTAQSGIGEVYISAVSSAVTIAGTPVAGDLIQFRIFRDVSTDTDTNDMLLRGVKILYNTNTLKDD